MIAKSNFGTTSITIIISVTDINDPPQFDKKVYRGDVQENSQPGSRIIQVNATDPDSGGFGDITYISEGKMITDQFCTIALQVTCDYYIDNLKNKLKKKTKQKHNTNVVLTEL